MEEKKDQLMCWRMIAAAVVALSTREISSTSSALTSDLIRARDLRIEGWRVLK